MPVQWKPLPRLAALGLAAGLTLAVAGCGGKGEGTDDATVITEPGSTVGGGTPSTAGPASTSPAASADAPKAEPAPAAVGSEPAAPAAATTAAGFGTLKGKVVFDGDAPAAKALVEQGKADKDPKICATKGAIPDQRLVVDGATKGVRYALVYIPKPTATSPEADSEAKAKVHTFDQANCVFEPHVLGVAKGSKVAMKNSDPAGHNVHSFLENAAFNESVQPNATLPRDIKQVSSRPGRVVCDIHPWMSSWWMATNSPYITVTDAQGNFELKNVPAGTQKVVVWTEASNPGFVTANAGDPVEVKAGGETSATFHLKPEMVKTK